MAHLIGELAILALVFGAGHKLGTTHPQYRHRHDWTVVEKTLLTSGVSMDDALRAAKQANYYVHMDEILDKVEGEKMVVHYRCVCGAEKVERI